jgi:putative addiction module killer protein
VKVDSIYVILLLVVTLRQYIDRNGNDGFGKWFDGLNVHAAAKVRAAQEKIGKGNFSNVEPVGDGVSEYKLDWGPGYRIYFGQDGETLVILVGGGTKKRQSADIKTAKKRWAEYKERKKQGEK